MKGIIFDLDGTMVDNMMVHHGAWQQKLAELGLEMSLEEVQQKVHGVNVEILERLFGDRFSPEERILISRSKEAIYRNIFLKDLKLINGLSRFLAELREASVPLAIGSAAPPENVDYVLDHLQLRHYFTAIVHAGQVSKGKPDPEVFERAAAGMGISVQECMVFEDSLTGAATAENAGSPAIIVTTTHRKEEFHQFSNILKFIEDFTAIDLAEIYRLTS